MRVGIIGGGAAGMMCAATIRELNPRTSVFLFEKNDILGKKVLISGGGRCNVTTGLTDIKAVLKKYPRGEKFLTTAMFNFSPSDVYTWFEEHGVPLVCEDDGRVFPKSNKGSDVVGVFENIYKDGGVAVLSKHGVNNIERSEKGFVVFCKGKETVVVDKVVLALGGQAYRQTGSSGDGYTLAEKLGHRITPLAASLYSFITQEKWPRKLAGVSFANAKIRARGAKEYSFTGSFLFTHLGVSGPAVFALSSLVAFESLGPKGPLPVFLDLLPQITEPELEKEFRQKMLENPKKSFKNVLHYLVPQSVVEEAAAQIGLDLSKKCAEVSLVELRLILKWLKHVPLNVVGRGAGDEFVTAGGVELSEVNSRTMESLRCPGLYLCGEILDVDGFTGGFNLQASWATGRAAGEHIAGL